MNKIKLFMALSIIFIFLITLYSIYYLETKQKNKEYFNNDSFIALTYDNSGIPTNTTNLAKLFENNGYNYKIVGTNKKWEGWYGRLNEYLNYINVLINEGKENYFVLICDGRDVLVNEHYDEFIKKARELYANNNNRIIFGAERHCCAGNSGINDNDFYKNKMIDISKNKTNHDYYYLNFGLIFGKAIDIKNLFESMDIKPDGTDQSLAVIKFCENPDNYFLDYNQDLFSNNSGECKLIWDSEHNKFKHEITNTYPSLLHFPGGNWDCYKECSNKLFNKFDINPNFYN